MGGLEGLLTVVDTLLCVFVFFPLAIFHWRGTWQLQDIYFLPGNLTDSSWVSLAIGANLGLVELLTQPFLGASLKKEHWILYLICSRIHMYIHGWAVMCFWRGVWNLMDIYLGDGWFNSLLLMGVCQIVSFVTRTTRTNVGIPMSIALDTDPDLLEPDTVFKVNPGESIRYMMDCLFTQFIIIISSITIWRGIWNMFDTFLLPDDRFLSDVISLLGGLGSVAILFFLQRPFGMLSARLDGYPNTWKLVYEDVVFLICTWANLLLWRGAWDLCIDFILPDPIVGSWTSHWIGTVGLMSLQVFNNVGLNGIERDGSHSGGEGFFPTHYLRTFLKDKIAKTKKVSEKEAWVEAPELRPILEVEENDADDEMDIISITSDSYNHLDDEKGLLISRTTHADENQTCDSVR